MNFSVEADKPSLLRSLSICFLFSFFAVHSALALYPNRRISEYAHTAWRIQDGFFGGTSIAQTKDGYIWIGTQSGLMRFDSVRFVPWSPPNGKHLPSQYIVSLLAGRDGSLWIGTAGGLSRRLDQNLINYPETTGWIESIFEDHEGKIWFTQVQADKIGGSLCQVVSSETRCYGGAEGLTLRDGLSLAEDSAGNLWWTDWDVVVQWKPGSFRTHRVRGMKTNAGIDGARAIAVTPSGALWVGMSVAGAGLGLQQLDQGKWKPFITPELDGSTLAVTTLFLDHEGSLWIGTGGQGLYRISGDRSDRFRRIDGLSSDTVSGIYEDHESNIWVATTGGIDSFRENHVTSIAVPAGIGSDEADGVLAARDGTVWLARPESLDALREGKIVSIQTGKGLPGNQVTSLLEDHAGRLWVGIDETLSIYENGKFKPVNRLDGRPLGLVTGITEDSDHDVWAETKGSPRTLFRIHDFKVQEEFPARQLPAARKVEADPNGGIWLGLMTGDLARYRKGQLEVFSYVHNVPNHYVRQLTVNPDGSVLGATSTGLIAWKNGKQQTLTARNGLPCDNIFAQIFDKRGSLWLYAECGLVEITNAELQKWWRQPDAKLQTRVLDVLDGARPGEGFFNGAARTQDGRLWFVNWIGLQMIDPADTTRNAIPPPVHIEKLIADNRSYLPDGSVRLPPLTRNVEIDYTGLSFVVPEKVRFRFKLEGHDTDWQEPGTRRQAFYNDLRPGNYRFHVVACNNDGIWNEAGATLNFIVEPGWYQTKFFVLLCLVTGTFMAWTAYALRVRKIAKAIHDRFDERLSERTRIAREFHDTLLQTIQGSKMVTDDALDESTDLPRMRGAMEKVSGWLGQAMQEGRTALNALRTSTTQTNDLAASFQRALDDCRIQGFAEVLFVPEGTAREMHPIVRDEIYRIGYEAIRNACQHSKASHLEVRLSYLQDIALTVSDNGKGIDPNVATRGRDGHYGLQGMRERATRINGRSSIETSADSGTTVLLIVPGRIVFRGAPSGGWSSLATRLKNFFQRHDGTSSAN